MGVVVMYVCVLSHVFSLMTLSGSAEREPGTNNNKQAPNQNETISKIRSCNQCGLSGRQLLQNTNLKNSSKIAR
jgi:hypothetical protein